MLQLFFEDTIIQKKKICNLALLKKEETDLL